MSGERRLWDRRLQKRSFWGDECVYYLDCGDGLMNMQKLILSQCKGGE